MSNHSMPQSFWSCASPPHEPHNDLDMQSTDAQLSGLCTAEERLVVAVSALGFNIDPPFAREQYAFQHGDLSNRSLWKLSGRPICTVVCDKYAMYASHRPLEYESTGYSIILV